MSSSGGCGGMADAQRSERCGRKSVEVQILSPAPVKIINYY